MIRKHYTSDFAKEKSREKVRQSIEETILIMKKPKDIRILCFPGSDAREVLEVYDTLKIPRENIVGLERAKDEYEVLKQRDLGIQLLNTSFEEYTLSQKQFNFDIVSLDYTGPFNLEQMIHLREFSSKQLPLFYLLHHANSSRREQTNSKFIYAYGNLIPEFNLKAKLPNVDELIVKQKKLLDLILKKESLKEYKDLGYSMSLRNAFDLVDVDIMIESLEFIVGKEITDSAIEYFRAYSKIPTREELLCELSINHVLITGFDKISYNLLLELHHRNGLRMEAEKETEELQSKFDMDCIRTIIAQKRGNFYFPTSYLQRYSYVSESGTPMIGDIQLLEKNPYKQNALKIATALGYPNKFGIRSKEEIKKYYNAIKAYEILRKNKKRSRFGVSDSVDKSPRVFLGNSSKPLLTKKTFIKAIKSGISVEEIKSKFRGWQGKPLSQWQAHISMGTYDKTSLPKGILKPKVKKTSLERDLVLELLRDGFTSSDIHESYPHISPGTISAYKAHMTMGTY